MENKEKEVRSVPCKFEVRELGEDKEKQVHIQGYALTFDTISDDLGGFKETIASGALDNCDMSDVVFDYDHDTSKILARNNKNDGKGALTLKVDEKGLFFDAVPTNTSYSRDLIENLKNGVVNKCSFIFNIDWSDPNAQVWDWDDGKRGYDFRTIKSFKSISDVSIVVFPAYNSTEISIYSRAKDQCSNEIKRAEEFRKKKIEIELECL
ncbi:HK97 family phage prohead protease [Clostridium botulinum]|uniref:Phage prohead protease, HK97 family n=1 Tax=Clostridium botulinum (strain Eklund 17B / Type B) TaxID=935198 RepID=B2TMF8_CLOBB|nr:HK97 family phage prohead protease [Clostridium sp. M14]ACD24152.1 phage prohead protease, HK97 family [Clostridium botulinum B str. Eklund 17B (NRP)]MBY6976810.1 HK97 family phage prohead protease [Clostridium botulinum]MBY7002303.1 HK97 family phage prohead protease [Clostridium botulinum]MBZ9690708.1 HK97 family phage prohead protease [Clostridium sp. M14]MCR1274094.1 HK97 family phage prohead protease [Clostridium botulinum]